MIGIWHRDDCYCGSIWCRAAGDSPRSQIYAIIIRLFFLRWIVLKWCRMNLNIWIQRNWLMKNSWGFAAILVPRQYVWMLFISELTICYVSACRSQLNSIRLIYFYYTLITLHLDRNILVRWHQHSGTLLVFYIHIIIGIVYRLIHNWLLF